MADFFIFKVKTMKNLYFVIVLFPVLLLSACGGSEKEKEMKELVFDGTYIKYDESVSDAEVKALGQFLIDSFYTDGSEMGTMLTKKGDAYIFKMEMLAEEVFEDEEFHEVVKEYAQQISDEVFDGDEVVIHLCNTEFETKAEVSSK
jgi:major membrane immunogen (membrane-anchored lipoprotein)